MTQSFDDAGKFGKEFLDSSLKSFAALSKGTQAIGVEAAEYGKKAFESANVTFEKLLSVKSLENTFEIQTEYAKQAYESFVAEATRISELYADLARETYKPFEAVAVRAK